MRLPFISRRNAEFTKGLVRIQLAWEEADHAETREVLAEAQRRLSSAMAELDRERAKRNRLKSYMGRMHTARYEQRIGRLRRAVAAEREQAEGYRRQIRQLTDRLFDACGYQGEPLLPAARVTLGIENAKEEG